MRNPGMSEEADTPLTFGRTRCRWRVLRDRLHTADTLTEAFASSKRLAARGDEVGSGAHSKMSTGGKAMAMVGRNQRITRRWILGTGVVVAAVAGCATNAASTPSTQATAAGLPANAAQVAEAKSVIFSSGQKSAVTLNSVRYEPTGDSLTELAVVDITINNASSAPMPYDGPSQVQFAYSDGNNKWTHKEDGNVYGSNLTEDYTPYMPPAPLRIGQIAPGSSVRGLLILRMSHGANYLLLFSEPNGTVDLAEWALTST